MISNPPSNPSNTPSSFPKPSGISKQRKGYGELMGMICYQGRHYTAYFYSESCRRWLMFDDALVSDVGSSWTDVLNKCCSYSLYPSILFYQSLPPNTTPSSHQSETKSFIPKLLFSPQFFPPSRPPPSINLSSSSPLHPHPHPHPHPRPLHPHPHPHPQPLLQPHPHPSLANPLINQPQINQQQMNQPQINQQQVNQHLINQQQDEPTTDIPTTTITTTTTKRRRATKRNIQRGRSASKPTFTKRRHFSTFSPWRPSWTWRPLLIISFMVY